MSSLKIKVCGMRDTENIREVSSCMPDLMGFVFYPPSARYAGDVPGERMFASFPQEIIKTGVFVDADPGVMDQKIRMFGLQAVQLHGNESPQICNRLKSYGLMVIRAFRIDENTDFRPMEDYLSCTDYFLFDTASGKPGGSGRHFNWDLLDKYPFSHPFFLSGGIDSEDADRILAIGNKALAGVDINSKFEISPGIKDAGKVEDFIDKIRGNDKFRKSHKQL